MRLDAVLENCVFYISLMYEFSHSQGQKQTYAIDYVRFTPRKRTQTSAPAPQSCLWAAHPRL
jgi:hypothetical protein